MTVGKVTTKYSVDNYFKFIINLIMILVIFIYEY